MQNLGSEQSINFSSQSSSGSPFANSFEGTMMLLSVRSAMLASQQNYLQILKFGTHIGQLILLPLLPYSG